LKSNRNRLKMFIAQISKPHLLVWGKILGRLLYYLAVPQRRIVRRNLRFSHPQWPQNNIRRVTKRFFKHFGTTILEIVQMGFFSREDMRNRIQVVGEENARAALRANKGIIVISAHLGNWEVGLQTATCYFGLPMTGIAKKMRNARLEQVIYNYRTRFGNKILYKRGALPEMMQVLRQGGVLGVMMDVSRRFDGVEVEFFGHRATATPVAALLALRCKSPVLPVYCLRNPAGNLIVHIEPPVIMERTNNLRKDLVTNTQTITNRLEAAVRRKPEQWLWTLKRWKEFYPVLYPQSAKRLHKIKMKAQQKRKGITGL